MVEKKFLKAVKCFMINEQEGDGSMISESLSSGEGTIEMSKDAFSVSSVNNRKRSFDTFGNEVVTEISADQNCLSIDSHMS